MSLPVCHVAPLQMSEQYLNGEWAFIKVTKWATPDKKNLTMLSVVLVERVAGLIAGGRSRMVSTL